MRGSQTVHLLVLLVVLFAAPAMADELRGTVTDAAGNPVAGARIDISTAAPKSGPAPLCSSCYLDCGKWAKSDERGRFKIASLDPTLKFRLLASAADKRTAATDLIDPARETASIVLADFPTDAPPNRILQGRVLSAEGVPISGALVQPHGAKTADRRWWGSIEGAKATITDDQGRFRMFLTEDYLALGLQVTAYDYAGVITKLLAPGEERHQITVPSGAAVIGRLEFQGKPYAGKPVAVTPANHGRTDRPFVGTVLAITDADGGFRFQALPADEPYAIFMPVGTETTGPVLVTKRFMAGENNATRDLGTLEVVPGLSLGGKIETPDGLPLPQEIRMVLGRMPSWDSIEVPVDAEGRFRIDNLPPDETYKIRIYMRGKELLLDEPRLNYQIFGPRSFAVRLTDSLTDLTIPLRKRREGERIGRAPSASRSRKAEAGDQTLAGKVVDPRGEPVAGVEVSAELASGGRLRRPNGMSQSTKSGANGEFEFADLPNEPIELTFYDPHAFGYPVGNAPNGRIILYPGYARPRLNQSNIRLLFDPALTTPPVDLH